MTDNILPTTQNLNSKHASFVLGLSALALGQALQYGNGVFSIRSIIWLTVSLLCLGYSLFFSKKPLSILTTKITFLVLITGLVCQIYQLSTALPGVYLLPSSIATLSIFQFGVIIGGGMALLSLAPNNWISPVWQNMLVGLTLLVAIILGVWVIRNSPDPFNDVFVFQQSSSEALLRGRNPYTLEPPNIYGHMKYYGAEWVENDRLTIGNPYPPLSIYFSTLAYLISRDIRYGHLLAVVLSAAFMAFHQPGRESKLAAFIFLFTPRVYFVVEQSWTEPVVILFLSATIFGAVHYPRWLPLLFGLLFASKQYLLFLIPLTHLLIPTRSTWRNLVKRYAGMAGVALAVTAPLALWNISEFYWNVGAAQWYQLFRMDALSYLALYARVFDQIPSQSISFVALSLAYVLVWRFSPRTPAGFATSIAWCLGIFFAFNKQAFCQYYFLVIGAICWAFAASTREFGATPLESATSA